MQTLKHSVVLTQIFAFLDGREKVRTQVLCRYCYCTVAPLLLASVPCEPEITLIEGFTLYRTFPHSLRNRERWETVCKNLSFREVQSTRCLEYNTFFLWTRWYERGGTFAFEAVARGAGRYRRGVE